MNRALLAFSILIAISGSTRLALSADALQPKQIGLASAKDIYHKGWIDFNKDGKKDVFEDPTQPLDKRIDDLLSKMNVEEKTCQLATLYGYRRVLKDPLPTP
ncbi:MAG: hypothetical protein ORN83_11585, partial [Chthoniobacteraceae bacterium]|nr:hypothetical protein [Chthoniobacteraceae bacterium]